MFNEKKPLPDDLIVPSRFGKNRSANHMLKRFHEDCARLTSATQPEGLRVRRQHDSRRTFVSLALANGADRESVKWIAHGRPTDVLGMYTESDWRRLCDAMLCVRVRERRVAAVATVREAQKNRGRVKRPAGEDGKDLLPSTPLAAKIS